MENSTQREENKKFPSNVSNDARECTRLKQNALSHQNEDDDAHEKDNSGGKDFLQHGLLFT